ncbi:hypothetical protein ACIBH1_05360 [Nonomuraea sp. NPDC050663]|uniref:hypothetical protein n=1 Tax=Nonomuraea sp. NPDC050663 TaxID=3364370 RepID=UPI00378999BE
MPPKKRTTQPAKPKTAAKRKPRRRKIVTVKMTLGLFRCKTCGKPYNLPWRHLCLRGFTASEARRTAKQVAASRRNLAKARGQR